MIIKTLLAATLLTATAARAAEPPRLQLAAPPPPPSWQLGLHHDTLWRGDGGYRTFSRDGRDDAVGLTLTRDLRRSGKFVLGLGLAWQREQVDGRHAVGRATFEVNAFQAVALARYELRPWLRPHLRFGAGASHGEVTFTTAEATYEAGRWAPSGEAGAGLSARSNPFSLRSTTGPWVSITATLEGGVQLGTAMSFDARGRGGYAAEDAIGVRSVPLGDLGRTHPYLRIGVGLAF